MKLQDRIKGLFTVTSWFILLRWAGDNFCLILVSAMALYVWENDVPSGKNLICLSGSMVYSVMAAQGVWIRAWKVCY